MIEVVRLRHCKLQLFHQAFEVLLGALLAMEADTVMHRYPASAAVLGEHVILLGLFDPLPRCPFHRGPFPWSRSLSGTTRVPLSASSSPWECGRSGRAETAPPAASGCGQPGRAGYGPA